VPLSGLETSEGAALTGIRTFTALQETDVQTRETIDEAVLPDASIPARSVSLGVAPAGTPEETVVFNTPATLSGGGFTGTVTLPDDYRVWARACLGDVCGPAVTWSPLEMVSVVSRKVHGSGGIFDLDLPLTGNPAIECRTGGTDGNHTLVFTFLNTLNSVSSVAASAITAGGTIPVSSLNTSGFGTDTHQYIADLSGVPNASHLTVALNGVADSAGSSGNVSVRMDVLLGDVTGNGAVSNTDVGAVKAQVNPTTPVTASNFRQDVSVNGFVTNTDVGTTKAQVGTTLP
jgi:hypothetical protein